MKKITILAIASFVLLLFSCDKNPFEIYPPDELGVSERKFYIGEDGGDLEIPFLSNKEGSIYFKNASCKDWASLGLTSFSSDATLPVHISKNDGFKRRADIFLETDTRCDTVSVFQEGPVEEKFYISANSILVLNGNTDFNSVLADINVPLDRIKTEVRYPGEDQWIKDFELTNTAFKFKTSDNPDKKYTRKAFVVLTFEDGWGEEQIATITVVQARSDNNIGTEYTLEELRDAATVLGYKLPADVIIEGYIVSTTEGRNAGDAFVEDYKQASGVIDYTLTDRTAYLESADGKLGFRLIATSVEENTFQRYSLIRLDIGGATVKKSASEPVCYTIEGVQASNILTSADGSLTMPWKEKSIDELDDSDINTLVKIKDCEIAMRKGPFTPVNEGYTSIKSYNRLAKYPILIRDKKGGSMYMFTNMTCPYRRNGETLPYGSGDITGIVVHEDYKSFEKNGNIGRYQLRHLVREEIDLKKDFEDNFSGLITEFRYVIFPDEFDETVLDDPILATKGNGELCHTYGAVGNYSPSYFYIGKCGSSRKYAEGAGIELDNGGIYQPWVDKGVEAEQNDDGKGWFAANQMLSWSNKYWWDSSNSRGYCWLVNFSTKGITSDKVSMQFAMYNNSQSARSPRYWKAQYSLTTYDCSPSADSQWKDIAEFTVPDVAIWASQNDWQTLGTRVYDFPLPTEILDKESVSIRLMPRNNKAAAKSEDSYDDSTIANNSGYNTMDYFAVRYNK